MVNEFSVVVDDVNEGMEVFAETEDQSERVFVLEITHVLDDGFEEMFFLES